MNSITEELHDLAWHQHEHDRLFHNDIFNMCPHDKTKHFVFHLTKYSCNLSLAMLKENHNEEIVTKPLLDSFIICLSLVNTFKLRFNEMDVIDVDPQELKELSGFMPSGDNLRGLCIALSRRYMNKAVHTDAGKQLIINFIELTSQAAKAVEAWDHLEDYPYIQKLNKLIPMFLELTLVALNYFGINYIADKYYQRMKDIESKHPFYDHLIEIKNRTCKKVM